MRVLGWLMLLLLGGWLIYAGVGQFSSWQGWSKSKVANWDAEHNAYTVYWLDEQQPLNFNIPANAEQIRVLFTAVVAHSVDNYSVNYQMFDSKGEMTQATRGFINDSELPLVAEGQLPQRFFARPDGLRAWLSRGFFIDNVAANPVKSIRLALASSSGARIAVRVSVLERKADNDVPVLWQRMRRDKRLQLMEDNIYPPDLVLEQQRRAVLKYSWLPLGPEGIRGKDHQQSTLFISNDIRAPQQVDALPVVNHMLAGAEKVFSFVNTPELGVASISCEPPDGSSPQWVELLKQPLSSRSDPDSQRYQVEQLPITVQSDGALYQLSSDNWCQVKLLNAQGDQVDIPAKVQRGYTVGPEQSLSYALTVAGDQLQPLRIDGRGLGGTAQLLLWQILAENDSVLMTGQLQLNELQDSYERLPTAHLEQTEPLQAKATTYILAPANAARLVITTADIQALVNVYTRPLILPHLDLVEQQQQQLQWFTLLPQDHNRLRAEQRSQVFYYQQRPLDLPQTTDAVASQWQMLPTVIPRASFTVVVPDPKGLYKPLDHGLQTINWIDGKRQTVRPTLIYSGEQAVQGKKITIDIDGQSVDHWLGSATGKIGLPSVSAGKHQFQVSGVDGLQWFVNKVKDTKAENRAKGVRTRQVYKLVPGLQFTIEKTTTTEWLSFNYYPTNNQAHRVKLQLIQVQGAGEYQTHTVPIRTFAIPAQTDAPQVKLLNQNAQSLWPGYVLRFPLFADLKPGVYQLGFTGVGGYVQASYIKDNMEQLLRQYREVANAL
jgi:hypothetical protein